MARNPRNITYSPSSNVYFYESKTCLVDPDFNREKKRQMEALCLQTSISSSHLLLAVDPGSPKNESSVENVPIEGFNYKEKTLKQFFRKC